MKITKTTYLHSFTAIVIVLALVRCATDFSNTPVADVVDYDSIKPKADTIPMPVCNDRSVLINTSSTSRWHRINSVPSYKDAFPDSNSVQIESAMHHGVSPVQNREDAEHRKSELVYCAANPFYYVDNLRESIPYLVPRASVLLQDIGKAFYDSLYVKGVPMHQIIVTSVLRTEEDVQRLRQHNGNASENSCHRYGTTFDICYNRYKTVETSAKQRRQVRNDTLKWILAEVLRDKRQEGRCHIKYEVMQGCFHITAK